MSREASEPAVNEFLHSAPNAPSALVIHGDPGIGKTTLWLDALRCAGERGFRVLAARTAAAESVLAYAALADLLSTVDDSTWADLPAPQRQSLDAAILRHRDNPREADPRAVAAGFLAVINALSAQGPVLVGIDDLQWLDTSSANVVSFMVRRLPAGVSLLCTTRTEDSISALQLSGPEAVHRIFVQPLTVGELHHVLTDRLGGSIARPTLLRIHKISGGNPFYALELAREISTRPGDARVGLPGSLAALVRTRIGRVSAGAEEALLAIASLSDPTVQLVAQAADTTPDRLLELLDEPEANGVISIDGNRLRFTHPILAHGVYSDAAPRRRRAMHRRLAEFVTERELHARHLALAATTPDPDTLTALDAAAKMARRRGAAAAGAELLDLAVRLGGDTPKRRIRSAGYHLDAGDAARARAMLTETISDLPAGAERAQALSLLAVVGLYGDNFFEATGLLERALSEVADHLPLRVQTLVTLSFALLNTGDIEAALRIVEEAVAHAEQLRHPQLLSQALSLRVHLYFRRGDGLDEISLRRALELEDRDAYMPAALRPSVQKALLLGWSGELDGAYEEMVSLRRRCIERGEENELIHVSFNTFQIEVSRGNFVDATLIANDAMERARLLGGDLAVGGASTMHATLAAYAGDERQARDLAAAALAAGQRCGAQLLAQWPIVALGFLEVSLGNYAAALSVLAPLLSGIDAAPDATEISVAGFMPDAAEALISVGRLDDAEPLIEALERNGGRLDRAWMLAVGARCRAMLLARRGDLNAAAKMSELAMTEHKRLPMPFERARTQLLLGQLERRLRRRDTSIATLNDALHVFERLGTTLWADRVRAEMAWGTSGKRRNGGLTPAEHRVAELAVSGMSNKDIAAALFISPKTVEVNLSRIYRKLDIRSRAELHLKLDLA